MLLWNCRFQSEQHFHVPEYLILNLSYFTTTFNVHDWKSNKVKIWWRLVLHYDCAVWFDVIWLTEATWANNHLFPYWPRVAKKLSCQITTTVPTLSENLTFMKHSIVHTKEMKRKWFSGPLRTSCPWWLISYKTEYLSCNFSSVPPLMAHSYKPSCVCILLMNLICRVKPQT